MIRLSRAAAACIVLAILGHGCRGGEIGFLGRSDHQVKLSGIRIELGEIEGALLRLPGVRQAAVLVEDDVVGTSRLVAYVEMGKPLRLQDVRHSLGVWLPQHMIPAAYMVLDRFPLTVAGKIDRARLAQAAMGSLQAKRSWRRRGTLSATARAVHQAWHRTLPQDRDDGEGPDPDVSWAEAGGDSLRSLQLLLRLEQALGRRVTFDLISPEVTPRELTRRLQADLADPIVTAELTMFLVPGLLGDEPILADFRRAFGPSLRFEVMEPPELGTPGTVLGSLHETGRWVAHHIAQRQPNGPVILDGYSFGAAVAYEAAAALLSAGRTIELLVVLDAPLAELGTTLVPDEVQWYKRLLLTWVRNDLRRRVLLAVLGRIGPLTMSRVRRPLLGSFRNAALLAWRPATLRVPGLVVLSQDSSAPARTRWTQLVPLLTLIELPARHRALFSAGSMDVLRHAVLRALESRVGPDLGRPVQEMMVGGNHKRPD